jgi:glycosyltransferase involved in cell wall biosynthesis
MRVVLAVPDFAPAVGGTSSHGALIASGLLRRGHDVVVVTLRRDRGWQRSDVVDGVRVERIGSSAGGRLGGVRTLAALAGWLRGRRSRIDVLQTLMWPDAATAAALAGLAGRTVVAWGIRGEITQALAPRRGLRGRLVVGLRRRHAARCAHVTLTPAMGAELAEAGLATRAVQIPVPVDTNAFRPPDQGERDLARSELGLAHAGFTVCYVGHLERRKGVERLVEAFGGIYEERSTARLLLVGGGPKGPEDTEPSLRVLVAQLGMEEVVRFCGVQPDPRPFLRASDVLVLPSFREGMPNALLEAMACGLPCIAPPSAGGDEVIEPETGVVPPSNAPEDLLAALRALAGYPGRRATMGRAAVERAKTFDVERVVDSFEELYQSVVAEAERR